MPVRTGVDGFDPIVGGGLPEGASVILQGPPGNEKDMFGLQFLAEGLRSGDAVLIAVSSTSPEQYLESLAKLGVNVKEAIAGNRLKVVDWHSYQEGNVAGVEERDHVLRCSVDLTNVGIALSRALAGLAPGVPRRAVLEILSPALQAFEVGQVYAFAQASKAKLARTKVTALFLLEKEMHSPATVSGVTQPFDGVIDIDRRREGDTITRKIGVPSMKDTVPDEKFHEFLMVAGRGIFIKPIGPPRAPSPEPAEAAPRDESAVSLDRARLILRIADERIRVDPKDADALFARASALASMGDLRGAVSSLDSLAAASDTYPGLWVLRTKLLARLGDPEGARESRRKSEEIQRREETRARTGETVLCPLCAAPVPVEAHVCPTCGARFIEEVGLAEELDTLGQAAIQDRIGEDLRVEPDTGKPVDRKPAPPKREGAVVESPVPPSREPASRTGMTNGLVREGLRGPTGRTNGLTNGVKGRTNGLTNGLKGRTNGLTNGLRGRTNGLTNGLRGRTNGLTNGLKGRTNGLTNGTQAGGRTNGLTNGLSSLRRGMTNGLTNGNGFTNGLGSARFRREARLYRWKLYVIPILSVLLLLLPLLGPSSMRREGPVIDGVFDDWVGVPGVAMTSAALDPDIDLTRVALVNSTDVLSLLIEVRGQILAGGPDPPALMDSLFVFVELDGDATTGYPIRGVGADRLLQISGRGGTVDEAVAYRASQAVSDRRDWRIWTDRANIEARAGGNRTELAVDWLTLGTPNAMPVFVVAARSWTGETDFADLHIGTQPGRVRAVQRSVAPTTLVGGNVPLLTVNLTAEDTDAVLSGLTIDLLGTAPVSTLSLIRLLDETGTSLANRTPVGRRVTFTFPAVTIPRGVTRTWTVSAAVSGSSGETLGARVSAPSDVVAGGAIVTLSETPSLEPLGYVGQVPAAPAIDGGYAEWTNDTLDSKGEPETLGNPSIDLERFGVLVGPSDFRFHLRVVGPALAGTVLTTPMKSAPPAVAVADRDRDGVPDSVDPYPDDFDNDGTPDASTGGDYDGDGIRDYGYLNGTDAWLNTTIPASFPAPYAGRNVTVYIGPVNAPPAIGEDTVRLFVDTDNNTATGYYLKGIGADALVEIRGREGIVGDSSLSAFVGSRPVDWNWTRVSTVALAVGDLQVEAMANLTALVPSPAMYLEISDWNRGRDDFGIGTRGIGGTRSATPFTGVGADFLPTTDGAFAFQSTGAGISVYARDARGADGDLEMRYGTLFLRWQTLGLGDPVAGLVTPDPSSAKAAGPNLVFGGLGDAWEQYEVSENHVKHNVWLPSPMATAGDSVSLAGELRFPAGGRILVDGRPWQGPFAAATELAVQYDGYTVRLDPVFAYESRRPDTRVSGTYAGDILNGTAHLSMTIPAAWLSDPSRQFPVVLDPSATGIIDTSTSAAPVGGPHQRNVFYDGTYFWAFYYDGTTIQYEPSSNGLDWVNTKNTAFTTASIVRVSTWFHDTGTTKIVYIVGDVSSGKLVYVRRGTISGTTISWGTEASVTVSAQNKGGAPYIARDSSGYLWIVTNNKEGGADYRFAATKSTNADDVSAWGAYTDLMAAGVSSDFVQGLVVARSGGDMYAIWYADGTIYGRVYTGGSWSGTTDTIDTTSAGTLTKGPSATVDGSFNIHLVYVDSSGAMKYRTRTSSWSAATTLDAASGNTYPTITLDAPTGDLYAFYISSTNQIKGQKYSGSWASVTLETNTQPKAYLTSIAKVGAAMASLVPNANGDTVSWVVSGTGACTDEANEWNCVSDDPNDGDSTYLKSTSSSVTNSFENLGTVTLSGWTVSSVVVNIWCRKTTASAVAVRTVIKTEGVLYTGAADFDCPNSGTYGSTSTTYTTNPFTGVAWTQAEVDALQAGCRDNDATTREVRCTEVRVDVNFASAAQYVAWTWAQGSSSPYDVKFSVLSTSLLSRTVDTSTDSAGTPVSFNNQRKLFYDGTYYWAFYFDGTNVVYTYSSDPLTWENAVSRAFATNGIDNPSVWYHDTGVTKIVYVSADGTNNDATAIVRRGTISGTTITWGTETAPTVTGSSITSKITFITRDTNGYLWIVSNSRPTASTYGVSAVKSTNTDDVSAWGARTELMDTSISNNIIYPAILPLSGGNLYAYWYADGTIAGKKYTGSWPADESIATTTAGVTTKIPSAVVDNSDNVHLAYIDTTGAVLYKERTSSWGSATTLDSTSGSISPTITIQLGTGNLYVFWIASSNQVSGKQYTGSWSDITIIETQTITKGYVTSPYSEANGGLIFMWGQGGTSPYEVKILKIPEFEEIVAPIFGVVFAILVLRSHGRRDSEADMRADGSGAQI